MQDLNESCPKELLSRIAVLIPCWQPDQRLIELARLLSRFAFRAVIVVNDGSEEQYEEVFAQVEAMPSASVLRHERNQGQGRAVRTAMRYALESLPGLMGIVTSDADGQHAVEDVVRVAAETAAGGRPVLGVRTFSAGVPLRSRFGNILTQYVFGALSGMAITDTQSGLRGIPVRWLPAILAIRGDRFEFAVSVLAELGWLGVPPRQVPIRTIYIDQNRSSHFRPVRDSIRIYSFLLGLYRAVLIPVCADLAMFVLLFAVCGRLGLALIGGRLAAMAAAVLVHAIRGLRRREVSYSLFRHIVALAGTGLISFGVLRALASLGWSAMAAKIPVEAAIWLALRLLIKPTSGLCSNGPSA